MPPRPARLEHSQSRYSCVKLVFLLKSILPSPFLAQNRNVLCISNSMSSPAFVYLGKEAHKQLDWSDKYPQPYFIMSGEHWGIDVTPSSGKMVTLTLLVRSRLFSSKWPCMWQWMIFVKMIKSFSCIHGHLHAFGICVSSYYSYKVKR